LNHRQLLCAQLQPVPVAAADAEEENEERGKGLHFIAPLRAAEEELVFSRQQMMKKKKICLYCMLTYIRFGKRDDQQICRSSYIAEKDNVLVVGHVRTCTNMSIYTYNLDSNG
jgi:hypothetical protein